MHEVAVVGAGFGGIGMAIRLRRAGRESFVVLEKAGDIGGTWRDNTYPGAGCDVPSHLYSYSFGRRAWPRRYGSQAEILRYLHELVDAHRLRPHIRLGAEVRSAVFDEADGAWALTLAGGEEVRARAIVSAVGQLNRPAMPDIHGLGAFAGPVWHSARWNHEFAMEGRRVAVIGTGASAIQLVPAIAARAARVHVFQRSAPYIVRKRDRPYGRFERWCFRHLPLLQRADRLRWYLMGELLGHALVASPRLRGAMEASALAYMRGEVADPDLRERCTPDYAMGCKRILFSSDWYATLQRPSVELVTDRIDRIHETGVVTDDGRERPVDAIVLATGFRATEFLQPMRVVGIGGRELHETWRAGAEAYRGVAVSGFPNFFMLYGPNTNLGSNSILFMLEAQIRYVQRALDALRDVGWLDVRGEVQDRFNRWVAAASRGTVWETGCHSWYTTATGRNTNNWPAYTFRYRRQLRRFDVGEYEARRRLPTAPSGP